MPAAQEYFIQFQIFSESVSKSKTSALHHVSRSGNQSNAVSNSGVA